VKNFYQNCPVAPQGTVKLKVGNEVSRLDILGNLLVING